MARSAAPCERLPAPQSGPSGCERGRIFPERWTRREPSGWSVLALRMCQVLAPRSTSFKAARLKLAVAPLYFTADLFLRDHGEWRAAAK